ncbi:hypothetical protein ACFU98_47180 [Streptomyces sp. NPDC057575]|uniref:hypothetical protein n=1 Tax=unclassified Streptomyces TaxID=2593676 RepID=UPI0036C1FC05
MGDPVVGEVAVADDGAEGEDGSAPGTVHLLPVMSSLSAIKWRAAPSTAPLAIGQPAARARA